MSFTLYILLCADGTLYVGHTDDMITRMQQHDLGQGSRYTATRRPLKLLHSQEFESRYEALEMERKLKGWSRAKKFAYMRGDWVAVHQLAKGRHRKQKA
jgi:predicted GIY-YIG superfamily endonuclease